MTLVILSVAIAYLLGSISSSYIVGRLAGNFDVKNEPDGRISAAVICYRIGALPSFIAILMDFILAALGVIIAKELTQSTDVMMLSGLAAMIGHNWSIFLKFKGGLGATAMAGAMLLVMFFPLLYGCLTAGAILFLAHKPGLGTAIGVIVASSIAFTQNGVGFIAGYPLALFALMMIKKLQIGGLADTEWQGKSLLFKNNIKSGAGG